MKRRFGHDFVWDEKRKDYYSIQNPDLTLLDVMLKRRSELLRKLRKHQLSIKPFRIGDHQYEAILD
jgi:DNA-binding response OmpR family regulator